MKAGFFLKHSCKAQNLGAAGGRQPIPGARSTSATTRTTRSTRASGSPTRRSASSRPTASSRRSSTAVFIYNNIEWYLQDNWKVNSRLTLDYGFASRTSSRSTTSCLQASNFFTDQWSRANAPLLYVAACPGNVNPCAAADRQAREPRHGRVARPRQRAGDRHDRAGQLAIRTNGLVRTATASRRRTTPGRRSSFGPRFGAAYDLSGDQRMVIRGSFGLFFDRPDGDSVYRADRQSADLHVEHAAVLDAAVDRHHRAVDRCAVSAADLPVRREDSVVDAVESRHADAAAVGDGARRVVRRQPRLQPAAEPARHQAVMDLNAPGFRRGVSAPESGSDARGECGAWRHGAAAGSAPARTRATVRSSRSCRSSTARITRFRRR